jgi:mRNA interferase HigB
LYNSRKLIYKQRMRVIAKKTLRDFWIKFPDAEDALKAWHAEAESASWVTPAAIKEKYRNASIIKGSRVVFNICGNKYRLVVRINYSFGVVYVRFVGTHKEYDAINVEVV